MSLRSIIVSFLIVCFVHNGLCVSTLKAVAMLTRHGDRSPVASYPNDPYGYSYSACGLGSLTSKGARQLNQSGMIKGMRYATLLQENNSLGPKNIYVRSSAVKRCILSAESFLHGLVPNVFLRKVKVNVPRDVTEDEMLATPGKPCDKHDKEYWDFFALNQPETLAITGGDQFVEYVANNAGEKIDSLVELFTIADTLIVQTENQLDLPQWAEPIYEDKMKPLYELYYQFSARSKRMQVRIGTLLNDMIERLEKSINGTSEENFLLYSGHDFTMSATTFLLGILDQTTVVPGYGAVLALELYQNSQIADDIEIKIFYFQDYADEHPVLIDIPGCPSPCKFNKFKDLFSERLIKNFDQECNNKI